MKKLHILRKPTALKDFMSLDLEDYGNDLRLKADKLQVRRWRRFKQQWV